jgi:DNA-binding phage protein
VVVILVHARYIRQHRNNTNRKITMMTLEEVKAELTNYSLAKVARKSGVDRHVIYRMMHESARPTYETVKRLSDWLEGPQL